MEHRWHITNFAGLGTDSLYSLLQLRQDVFVVEQACIYRDLDDLDLHATHMLCWQGDELWAYQRCLRPGLSYPESSLGRIVVNPRGRGTGLGRELVARGIAHNLQQWPGKGIRINAQSYLRGFYLDLGFTPVGKEYDEDGIMHQQMLYDPGLRSPAER
jgi:ElaA protein